MGCREWTDADEEALVLRAQDGDLGAFDQLARHFRPALVRLVRQIDGRADADDIAQETLLLVFKSLGGLRDPAQFSSWAATIARRLTMRSGKQRREHLPLDRLILAYAPGIGEDAEAGLREERLMAAVAKLEPESQTIVALYYGHQWSVDQVSNFMSLPKTTVKWRLHMARTHLKEHLTPEFED